MKNIILFILFLVSIFVLNIIFYYTVPKYQEIIKIIKLETWWEISTSNNLETGNIWFFSWKIEEQKIETVENNSWNTENTTENVSTTKVEEVKLWQAYQNILNLFSWYELKSVKTPANLFDLTNEYPDSYYEFYSNKLSVYFFTTRDYKYLSEMFWVLATNWHFSINETNAFWEKSFFINLREDIKDDFIRLVILNKWISFWIKVEKNEYNNIKEKLQNLRNN